MATWGLSEAEKGSFWGTLHYALSLCPEALSKSRKAVGARCLDTAVFGGPEKAAPPVWGVPWSEVGACLGPKCF